MPSGFTYHAEFISAAEEQSLLEIISRMNLRPMVFQGYLAKRKVASFGYDYSFDKRSLTKGTEIPSEFYPVLTKVAAQMGVSSEKIAELLVTEYPIGSVINWHRDAPPFDIIAGVSLASDCILKLRPHQEEKRSQRTVKSLPVERRSFYVMTGISRTDWQHCVSPVSEVRYSLTFRTLK